MNDQYFTRNPESESRPEPCSFSWRGCSLRFETDAGVFSRGELDHGTRVLMDALPEKLSGDVLDLGCGWGAIGISMAKYDSSLRVTLTDVNTRALSLAEKNAKANGVQAEILESDGFSALGDRCFDAVITNPPIRAGKQVIYRLFTEAAAHLKSGGSLYLVIRKQQGAESAMKLLQTLFSSVEKLDRSGGFWVLRGEKGGLQK